MEMNVVVVLVLLKIENQLVYCSLYEMYNEVRVMMMMMVKGLGLGVDGGKKMTTMMYDD